MYQHVLHGVTLVYLMFVLDIGFFSLSTFITNESSTRDTAKQAEAAYQISSNSDMWLMSFSDQKILTDGWRVVKRNAPGT